MLNMVLVHEAATGSQEPRATLTVKKRPTVGQAHRLVHQAIDLIDLGGLASPSRTHLLSRSRTLVSCASASPCASWRGLD
jgi:hypothetical protein